MREFRMARRARGTLGERYFPRIPNPGLAGLIWSGNIGGGLFSTSGRPFWSGQRQPSLDSLDSWNSSQRMGNLQYGCCSRDAPKAAQPSSTSGAQQRPAIVGAACHPCQEGRRPSMSLTLLGNSNGRCTLKVGQRGNGSFLSCKTKTSTHAALGHIICNACV